MCECEHSCVHVSLCADKTLDPAPLLFYSRLLADLLLAYQWRYGGGGHLLKFISTPAHVPSGTDMAPGEEKQLYVAFWSGGVLREVLLSDTTAAKLPACAAATAVSDPVRRAALLARAAAVLGVQLA